MCVELYGVLVLDPPDGGGMRCMRQFSCCMEKILVSSVGMGVIGYRGEKLLDSYVLLCYIRDLRCGVCYAFGFRYAFRYWVCV